MCKLQSNKDSCTILGVETWQTVKITNASSSDVGRDNKKRQSNKPNIITVTNDMYYSVHGDIGANVSTSGEAVITETVETSAVVGEELDSDDRQGAYVRFTESQRSTSLSPQPAEQSTDGGNIEPATTTASADSYGREVCFQKTKFMILPTSSYEPLNNIQQRVIQVSYNQIISSHELYTIKLQPLTNRCKLIGPEFENLTIH